MPNDGTNGTGWVRAQSQRWLQQSLEQHGRYITNLIQKQGGALPPKPDLPPPPPALQPPPPPQLQRLAPGTVFAPADAGAAFALPEHLPLQFPAPVHSGGRSSPAPGMRRSRSRYATQSYSGGDGGALLQQWQEPRPDSRHQHQQQQRQQTHEQKEVQVQLVSSNGLSSTGDGGQVSSLAFPPLDGSDGATLSSLHLMDADNYGGYSSPGGGMQQPQHGQQQLKAPPQQQHHEREPPLVFEAQPDIRLHSAAEGDGGGGASHVPSSQLLFDPLQHGHSGGLGDGHYGANGQLMGNGLDSRWVLL